MVNCPCQTIFLEEPSYKDIRKAMDEYIRNRSLFIPIGCIPDYPHKKRSVMDKIKELQQKQATVYQNLYRMER